MQLKKVLAIVLSVVMIIGVMPFAAFAGAPGSSDIGGKIDSGVDLTPATGFMVGETNYADFEVAVAAAKAGSAKTVTCLSDIDLTQYPAYGTAGSMHYIDISGVTVDLDNHTMTIGGRWSTLFTGTDGKIMNGTCVGTPEPANYQYGLYIWGPGSGNLANSGGGHASIALENLTCNYGIHTWNADVTITNCDVTGSASYYAVWADEESYITVESGNYTTGGAAVFGCATSSDGQGHINIEGGDIVVPAGKKLAQSGSQSIPENVKFSGGTVNVVIPAENCADGFAPVTTPNAQGKYTVDVIPTGFMVGEEHYETLAEALAGVQNGQTITFLEDAVVTSPVFIPAAMNIKLDLNGHTLSGNIADADGKKLIQVSGQLEFVGENGGCIYNTNVAGQGHAACQALTGGTVIVNSPIHFGDSDTDMTNANSVNRGCGIQNNGGTLIINDGYFTSIDANYSTGAWAYAILNCAGNTTVNNATVYGLGLHGALGCEEGSLTVNSGTFAVNGANNYYSLYADGGEITVNGGEFTDNSKYGVNYVGTNSSVTITGGEFTYPSTTPFVQQSSKSNPVLSGGSFSSVIPADCCAEGFAPVTTPNAQGKYEVGQPQDGANITISDTISQNFYLDEDFYGEDAVVVMNYNHQSNVSQAAEFSTDTVAIGDMDTFDKPGDAHNGDPMFSIIQAPAQATEPISIKVYANAQDAEAGKNVVREIEYNVYTYCREIIEGEYTDNLKELAESTLDYAGAAQTYFAYNTDNMATTDAVGGFYNDVDAANFSTVASISKPDCIKKASMIVTSDLGINLLSNRPIAVYSADIDATNSRFAVSDEVTENGTYYVISISGIEATNMNQIITISTSEGYIDLTANAIMKAFSTNSDTNLATLAKAMYLYGQAASNCAGA